MQSDSVRIDNVDAKNRGTPETQRQPQSEEKNNITGMVKKTINTTEREAKDGAACLRRGDMKRKPSHRQRNGSSRHPAMLMNDHPNVH